MPWRELTTMSQRTEFVYLASQEGANITELCERFRISRTTGYKWIKRYLNGEPLSDRSRRPHSSPNRTKSVIEEQIIKVRRAHPAWGGRKIEARLLNLGHQNIPKPSTITAVLNRNGLIQPQESDKHRAFQRFEKEEPNELWQMDFKGYFNLTEGGSCHPLTVLDDHSRFLLGLEACSNQKYQTVQEQLTQIFQRYGLPERMLMDNGAPWGNDSLSCHTILTAWLLRLGIKISHGRPRHPQTQGKDERLHRTLTDELLCRSSFPNLEACKMAFDDWRFTYNYERPHESIKMQTPSNRYRNSVKKFPEKLPPIVYDDDCIIRTVDRSGQIGFRNQVFQIGKAFRYNQVGIRATELEHTFFVYFCDQVVAKISLV